jgi:kynureninase
MYRFAGWWGHDPSTRFQMPPSFSPIAGAQGFQQSNPSVLASISLLGSLRVFEAAGMMHPLRKRSVELTGVLEARLARSKYFRPLSAVRSKNADQSSDNAFSKLAFTIITPTDPGARGAQLSLLFLPLGSDATRQVFDWLSSHGVIGDRREPDVIRLSPAPLYNTLEDCERAAICLEEALDSLGSVGC